ncbi:MAG TPA: tyrosinase family protein [Longimicrobium sp.]
MADTRKMERRDFLKTAAAVALSGSVLSELEAQPRPWETEQTVWVRRSINSFTSAEIDELRKAVTAMQSRPSTNPLSWAYQAAIHGTYASGSYTAWNTCQHGSYFFLSWHRMYLYYFDRILRAASSSQKLVQPYWPYEPNANRAIPTPYRNPASTSNSLYVSQRGPGINDGAELPVSSVDHCTAYSLIPFLPATGQPPSSSFGGGIVSVPTHFASVYGQLELVPHNRVHSSVGGWMGDPNTAAQDPLFWTHHCNVDRLWEGWLALGGGRANPTGNSTWMNTAFTFFDVSSTGTPVQVTLKGAQILDIVAQLNYRYDALPVYQCTSLRIVRRQLVLSAPHLPPLSAVEPMAVAAQGATLGSAPVSVELAVSGGLREALSAGGAGRRIELRLEGIRVDRNPGVAYHIYLGLAPGEAPRTLDPENPHPAYIGTLDFFEIISKLRHDRAAAANGYTVAADITDLTRTAGARVTGSHLMVTFVPEGLGGRPRAAAPTRIRRVLVRAVAAPRA